MKKIIALMLCAVMAFALVACASKGDDTTADANTEPQTTVTDETTDTAADTTGEATDPESTEPDTTEEPGTEPVTTEEPGTEPESTEPVTTEEPTTTAPETTKPETTAPETTKPETTAPETTTPDTTKNDDNSEEVFFKKDFNYLNIIFIPYHDGFSLQPAGVYIKDGVKNEQCYFNYYKRTHEEIMTLKTAKSLIEKVVSEYTIEKFDSYLIDNVPVTRLDYTWNNENIYQSFFIAYFDEFDICIELVSKTEIEDGIKEYDEYIKSMRIKKPTKIEEDKRYYFDRISVIKPEGYTFKDFAGAPSGLKDGVAEGQCFFNFSLIDPTGVMTEEVARNTLEGQKATIGDDYTLDSFKSYEVDGVPVTKLDYTWGNGGLISQSMVLVNFEDKTVFIAYATLTSIEGAIDEFNAMIDSLTIIAK